MEEELRRELSQELIDLLNDIMLKENDFNDDSTIEEIKERCKTLSIWDIANYIGSLSFKIMDPMEEIVNKNFFNIISFLFDINKIISVLPDDIDIEDFVDFLIGGNKYGVYFDVKSSITMVLSDLIQNNKWSTLSKFYDIYFKDISEENKRKILESLEHNCLQNIEINGLFDLMSFALKENKNLNIFTETFSKRKDLLVEMHLKEEFKEINKNLFSVFEKENNEVSKIIKLLNKETFDEETYNELLNKETFDEKSTVFYDSESNYKKNVTVIAIEKGYIPNIEKAVKLFTIRSVLISNFDKVVNENLVYYFVLNKDLEFNEKKEVLEILNSETKKKTFEFLEQLFELSIFNPTYDYLNLKERTLFYLEKYLSNKNINNYFNEFGCKKEFLDEIIESIIIDNNEIGKNIIVSMYLESINNLNEFEKQRYSIITFLLNFSNCYDFIKQVKNPEIMANLINSNENIINCINSFDNPERCYILVSFVQAGIITEEIKQLLGQKTATAIRILEGFLKNEPNIVKNIDFFKHIFTSNVITDDGKLTSDFISYYINYFVTNKNFDMINKLNIEGIPNETISFLKSAINYFNNIKEYCNDNKLLLDEIKEKKELIKFINSSEDVVKFIQSFDGIYRNNIIASFTKEGVIDDEIKSKLGMRMTIAIEVLEEIFKNYYDVNEIMSFFSSILSADMITENGKITPKFIIKLVDIENIDIINSLIPKYVSKEEIEFISLTKNYINVSNNDCYDFIFTLINNKDELKKVFNDGKINTSFIDQLLIFENDFARIKLIDNYETILSQKQQKIISIYDKVDDKVKDLFSDFIKDNLCLIYNETIKEELLEKIPDLLKRIKLSNSSEIAGRYKNITKLILANTEGDDFDPNKKFEEIEKVFLTRNLSHMDKIFKSFQLLYPHDKLIQEIIEHSTTISPTLLKYATAEDTILGKEAEKLYGDRTYAVEMLMYADLLKTTLASNDKSFIEYIENIEKGNVIFLELIEDKKSVENLSSEDKYVLNTYIYHLENLYNKENPSNKMKLLGNLEEDLYLLLELYKDKDVWKIPDQIIKNNYYSYLGIKTLQELKELMIKQKQEANANSIEYAKVPLRLEKGDLIKGIGDIKYFDTIIQNGSVSKEFLGGDVGSDLTPFDTDLSLITIQKESNEKSLSSVDANGYGPIFFVIKNAIGKYNCTRGKDVDSFELVETPEQIAKIEMFRTVLSDTHYGIRTGFATSQVNYICCEKEFLIDKIGVVLAKNGFYIPVVNLEGKLLFTPEDYDKLRGKMNGLSYYGVNEYNFSNNLVNLYVEYYAGLIADNIIETAQKKKKVEEKLRQGFASSSLEMKLEIDGDLRVGSVELIDTGSTGRGTNQIGDGDFDYTIRIDRIDDYELERKNEIQKNVCKALGVNETVGDLRKAKVNIGDEEVEVDLSYAVKSDKITYTTDMSLMDRLETIKRQDPKAHLLVLSNIVLAKSILKKAECYKPQHAGENPQGGLGGVGVENWILQNGGSLEEAATEFLIAAGVIKIEENEKGRQLVIDENLQKDFNTFNNLYSVWDFGQNQLSESRKRDFPYDNFVGNNMNSSGYEKMVKALQTYLLELHPEFKFIPKKFEDKEKQEKLESVATSVKELLIEMKPVHYIDINGDIDESLSSNDGIKSR